MYIPETIERFVEDQAFLRSYDSAPRPPAPSHPSSPVSLSQSSCVSTVKLTDDGGGRCGRGAKSWDRVKAWSSMYHSILSDIDILGRGLPGGKVEWGHEIGAEWRRGAKSYDREKAWSSMNHSILSGLDIL